jgi:hypothetical protein
MRLWIEGLGARPTVIDPDGFAPEDLPVVVIGTVDLGPRPVPEGPPVRLPPSAMAILIGRRQAHGHGLEPEQATALQRRLDAGVRHWTVRVQRGEWRRNLEVLEGDGGIWRVRPVAGDLVELAPASTTGVVRELVALLRREDRPAAP